MDDRAQVFNHGDFVLLISKKQKRWLVKLDGTNFQTHLGVVPLSKIEGMHAGSRVITSKGHELYCMHPTLADFVVLMQRKAQIIYPKDLAAILFYGDVKKGLHVLESGTGSGALTMALLRAVGDDGKVVSVEWRREFSKLALKNITDYFGEVPQNLELLLGDVNTIRLKDRSFDRVFLDLPEPWKCLKNVSRCLVDGGIIVTYSPNISQVQEMVTELKTYGYADISTFEVLLREWFVDEKRTRPKDRMVGHTGFITIARKTCCE